MDNQSDNQPNLAYLCSAISATLAAVMALAEKVTGEKLVVCFDPDDGFGNRHVHSNPGFWFSPEAFEVRQRGI